MVGIGIGRRVIDEPRRWCWGKGLLGLAVTASVAVCIVGSRDVAYMMGERGTWRAPDDPSFNVQIDLGELRVFLQKLLLSFL